MVIRGTAALGRGFVSGHAAVVTALVVVAWPWLNRPGRVACAVLAAAVCLSRVYVGAHLPLDVVGGAALGLAVAGVRPARCRAPGLMLVDIRRGLLVSGGLLAGAAVVGVLVVWPVTRAGGAGRRRRGVAAGRARCENRPTTAVAVGHVVAGQRVGELAAADRCAGAAGLAAALAAAGRVRLAMITSELLIGPMKARDRPAPATAEPDRDQRGVLPVRARDRRRGDRGRPRAGDRRSPARRAGAGRCGR